MADVVFDGYQVRKDQVIEIRGDRIYRLANVAFDSKTSHGLRARFAMPGLVDSHVHISGYRSGIPSINPHSVAKDFVRLCLLNGVTTLRDVGNSLDTIQYLKTWLDEQDGPHVYSSGPLLDGKVPTWSFTRSVTSQAEADLAIQRLKLEQVDFVKIYQSITRVVFEHLVTRAHAESLKVAFHSGDEVSAYEGAARGVDSLEHAINLLAVAHENHTEIYNRPNAAIRHMLSWAHVDPIEVADHMATVMKSNQTMLCPTLLVSRRWSLFTDLLETPSLEWASLVMPYHKYLLRMRNKIGYKIGKRFMATYFPVVEVDKKTTAIVRNGYRKMCDTVALLHHIGVQVITGTDSPNPSLAPGFSLHDEIRELHLMCGLSALECLKSVTSVPASFLGKPIGIIAPGAYADLILIDGDPTENIDDLSRISHVICRGKLVDLEALKKRLLRSLRLNE